jgi:hypothetical protein
MIRRPVAVAFVELAVIPTPSPRISPFHLVCIDLEPLRRRLGIPTYFVSRPTYLPVLS